MVTKPSYHNAKAIDQRHSRAFVLRASKSEISQFPCEVFGKVHSMSFVLYSSFPAAYRSRFTYSHSRGGTETPKQPLRDFDCIINECIVYKSGWNVIILLLVERCIFWLLAGQELYHHQSCDITYRKHD